MEVLCHVRLSGALATAWARRARACWCLRGHRRVLVPHEHTAHNLPLLTPICRQRYEATGSPRNLGVIWAASVGDSKGRGAHTRCHWPSCAIAVCTPLTCGKATCGSCDSQVDAAWMRLITSQWQGSLAWCPQLACKGRAATSWRSRAWLSAN